MRQFRVTILAALALVSTWGLAAGETSEPTTERSSNLVRPTYTPVFSFETNLPPRTVDCVPEPMLSDAYDRNYLSSMDGRSMGSKASLAQFPLMDWPLDLGLEDDLCLVAYADLDRTGPDTLDFEGNIHATNGHRGLDLALLSFHQMDQGAPIHASADGTVEWIEWTKFDRNVLGPFPDQGNYIILRHFDNTFTYYWHMRKNSTTVQLGEFVEQGRMLGMIGSSGFSFQAHVHWEAGYFISGNWIFQESHTGSSNPLPSLWNNQKPYIGMDPVRVFDMDVVNLATANGNFGGLTSPMLMERLTAPALMGIDEQVIQFWVLLSGQAGGSYTINIYRPDQSLFGTRSETLTRKRLWTWKHHSFSFSNRVSAADIGTWRMQAVVNDTVIYSRDMEVGSETEYAPRFYPVAGRSFHVEGNEIRDTLRLSQFSSPSSYGFLNAADYVSLIEDSIVVIDAGAILAQRSVLFQIEATDDAGHTDTMWYHLIDVNRPLSCGVAKTGDVDLSTQITSADIIGSVNYVFKGGATPLPCEASADVNCSGAVTSADVIYMVNHVFKGGPTPCDVCTIIPGTWGCP